MEKLFNQEELTKAAFHIKTDQEYGIEDFSAESIARYEERYIKNESLMKLFNGRTSISIDLSGAEEDFSMDNSYADRMSSSLYSLESNFTQTGILMREKEGWASFVRIDKLTLKASRDAVYEFRAYRGVGAIDEDIVKPLSVKKGQKLTSIMKVLFSRLRRISRAAEEIEGFDISEEMLEDIINRMNTILDEMYQLYSESKQREAVLGVLTLSIRPSDILTMSDNSYNWTSCMRSGHSRDGAGEYSGTPRALIQSGAAVIAYFEMYNGSKFMVGGEEYSNKTWRRIGYMRDGVLAFQKSYPFNSSTIDSALEDLLENNGLKRGFSQEVSEALNSGVQLFGRRNIYLDQANPEMFFSSTDRSLLNEELFFNARGDNKYYRLGIFEEGAAPVCLSCESHDDFDEGLCSDCSGNYMCESCGYHTNRDDYMTDDDGNGYCSNCYYDQFSSCENCGEEYLLDDHKIGRLERYVEEEGLDVETNCLCSYCLSDAIDDKEREIEEMRLEEEEEDEDEE